MKEKACGSCSSKTLVPVRQKYNAYYSPHISLGIGCKARIRKTICEQCGHVDEWIESESVVRAIKKKYSN